MESPLVKILYNGSEVNHQIRYAECVEETDFGQLIIIKLVK